MEYWETAKEAGLSKEEINVIAKRLWEEANTNSTEKCNDCGVATGEVHEVGCDVARCINCGAQALSCDCGNSEEDVWTGLWPGLKECYEQKLICRGDFGKGNWTFDLNTLSRLQHS